MNREPAPLELAIAQAHAEALAPIVELVRTLAEHALSGRLVLKQKAMRAALDGLSDDVLRRWETEYGFPVLRDGTTPYYPVAAVLDWTSRQLAAGGRMTPLERPAERAAS